MEPTKDFKVGDTVVFIPNGLEFKCLDMKMWKRMQDSGNYVKKVDVRDSIRDFYKPDELSKNP